MNWPYENSAYQVAGVDGLAIFYGVHSDGMSLRGQSFDLTDEELDKSLRMGGFRLTDVAATPDGQTPFIGDFVAVNGSRQLVGLSLIAVEVKKPRTKRVVEAGSVLSRAIDSALHVGFRHRGEAEADSPDVVPAALLANAENEDAVHVESIGAGTAGAGSDIGAAESSLPPVFRRAPAVENERVVAGGACPYLRKRDVDSEAAPSLAPSGSESATAREYRCVQAQGMLVMTVARLERLCEGGGYTQCRHYRYTQRQEATSASTSVV